MYDREVDEGPPSLETIWKAVEQAAEWKQDNRDEVDGVWQSFQRYPSVVEILRELIAQAG